MTAIQESRSLGNAELSSLVTSIRRLTIAVWCLAVLLIVSFAAPWIMFFFSPHHGYKIANQGALQQSSIQEPHADSYDNDFHAYPPEEQIKRATVILVTVFNRDSGKEVIAEIVKRAPGVRFYYKVGGPSPMPYHSPRQDCADCETEGQVVLLQGNPAELGVSYSYDHDRIEGMDGMALAELRQFAQKSLRSP